MQGAGDVHLDGEGDAHCAKRLGHLGRPHLPAARAHPQVLQLHSRLGLGAVGAGAAHRVELTPSTTERQKM